MNVSMDRGCIFINVPDDFDIHVITDGLLRHGFSYKRREVASDDEEGAIRAAEGCVGVIAGMEPWNERTIRAVCRHVRMIIRYGTGYNSVDLPAASRHGVAVFNAAGRNAAAVAEIALLHILNAGRQFAEGAQRVRRGDTARLRDTECFELDGRTVGLLGAGAIARQLVRLLSGFKVRLLAYDPVRSDELRRAGVQFVDSPEELMEHSDIVSLHLPLLPATQGLVDARLLSHMKQGAVLVNTSRGPLVNERDLLEALREGRLRYAGLDVLCAEPMRQDDPLVSQRNACVTPHIGATSYDAKLRVERCLYETIADFFDGKYETEYPLNYLNPPPPPALAAQG